MTVKVSNLDQDLQHVECCTPSSGCAIHHPLANRSGSEQPHSFCRKERETEILKYKLYHKLQNILVLCHFQPNLWHVTNHMLCIPHIPIVTDIFSLCLVMISQPFYQKLSAWYQSLLFTNLYIISMIIYERVMWCQPPTSSFSAQPTENGATLFNFVVLCTVLEILSTINSFTYLYILSFSAVMSMPFSYPLQSITGWTPSFTSLNSRPPLMNCFWYICQLQLG